MCEEWVVSEWVAVRGDGEGVQGGGEGGEGVDLIQGSEVGTLETHGLRERERQLTQFTMATPCTIQTSFQQPEA